MSISAFITYSNEWMSSLYKIRKLSFETSSLESSAGLFFVSFDVIVRFQFLLPAPKLFFFLLNTVLYMHLLRLPVEFVFAFVLHPPNLTGFRWYKQLLPFRRYSFQFYEFVKVFYINDRSKVVIFC